MASRVKSVRFRADEETARWCKRLYRWRGKRSITQWLDEFVQRERRAYQREKRGDAAQTQAS